MTPCGVFFYVKILFIYNKATNIYMYIIKIYVNLLLREENVCCQGKSRRMEWKSQKQGKNALK